SGATPQGRVVATARSPATTAACHPRGASTAADGARGDGAVSDPRRSLGDPVADAEDGLQVARRVRVGLDLAADVLDVRVDGALVGLHRDAVDGVEELRPGEHPTGLARHVEQ